jgi:hypothetical protein
MLIWNCSKDFSTLHVALTAFIFYFCPHQKPTLLYQKITISSKHQSLKSISQKHEWNQRWMTPANQYAQHTEWVCALNSPWLGSRRQDCPSTPAGRWGQCLGPRCCRPGRWDSPSRAGRRLKQKERTVSTGGLWPDELEGRHPPSAVGGFLREDCMSLCLSMPMPRRESAGRLTRRWEREREPTLRCVLDRPNWLCDV